MDINVRIRPSVVLIIVTVLVIVHELAAAAPQPAAWLLLPCFVLSSIRLTRCQEPSLP
jgi:hypothetical protein